jgi:hypothetical protein
MSDEPHCPTCACAAVGYVRQARWGEWEAVCTIGRCGWHHSMGNRTQADAEKHLALHAALIHPPRTPVSRS